MNYMRLGSRTISESASVPVILVVDDEIIIQFLVRDILEDDGYRVILASSYSEAISIINSDPDGINGLVTDINIGGPHSGWDIATAARERIPTLPVIYISGDSAHAWPVRGVPQSVIIAKPFAPAQIVAALASMTDVTDSARVLDEC